MNSLEPESDLESDNYDYEPKSRGRIRAILDACGWRFLMFLLFSQFCGKGIIITLVDLTVLPLFKNAGVDAASMQLLQVVILLPWSLKPIIGLCSDYILLFGFHKRGWLLIGILMGVGSSILLCFVYTSIPLTVCCLVGIHFQLSLIDLLSEGKYAEIRNANPHIGSDLTTLVQGMQLTGAMISVICVGPLADRKQFFVLFLIAAICCASPLVPTLLGWMPEPRKWPPKCIELVERERLRTEWRIICVVAFCGMAGITTSMSSSLLPSPIYGLIIALVLMILCLVGCALSFPRLITCVALYQVITTIAQPSMGGAMDYFYTAGPECLPDGPHFSFTYYITYAGIVGILISIVGTVLYAFLLSKLRFRKVLLLTSILVGAAGLSDLFIILRWNTAIGIPDQTAYIVGEAVVEPLVGMLQWIPTNALITIAATHGTESTCFALMAGISNFARLLSQLSGAIIFTAAGVSTSATKECDFGSLWWLVLICHVVSPTVLGVAATWLIPDREQNE